MRMNEYKQEIKNYILDHIGYDFKLDDEDLHHKLFNMDYYIIGYYQATKWLGSNAFNIIGIIQEYENFHFGTVHTDLSCPEKVANMYAYILGEEAIQELRSSHD